ncbi:MAG TPA: ATP-binding protein [Azospirillaceae bacterium]|nr:ATP-binding protein [Azospirillaceae bacterium]
MPNQEAAVVDGTTLELRIANDLEEVSGLIEAVEAFCEEQGAPPKVSYQLCLVIDEIVTNIISYAYEDEGRHEILLRFDARGGGLSGTIEDDGKPFNPLTDSAAPDLDADIDDRPIGGLGVFFLKSFMDSVGYERDGGLNRLSFAKTLVPATAGNEA